MLTPKDLLAKGRRAAASAVLLLSDGDIAGACNRAYCAMFDAAHAALFPMSFLYEKLGFSVRAVRDIAALKKTEAIQA
ncbi:hypothetical protein CS8_083160 [Cupriavidus sp. 8B]